ncbi:MAG: hypothetical protein ACE15C_13395 [Phycisphaerae bacterium]
MKKLGLLAIGMLAMCLAAYTAVGQTVGGGDATTPPAVKPDDAAKPAEEPKKDESALDDLSQVLENMTPEELQALIKKSAEARLSAERQQVAAEVQSNVMFDDLAKDAALKALEDKPANTQKDNIERIARTFAAVDERFAAALKLYDAKDYDKAAEALKKLVNTKEINYFGACKGFLMADSLHKAGLAMLGTPDADKEKAGRDKVWAAVDAYRDMLENMPDRVSFSASAAINCADAYERLGRGIYAMEMYGFCVKNFALTLDKDQVEAIAAKVDKLTETYKDPMASVSRMMGDVKDRLARIDSGKETQQAQKEIVALLEDLIKTTEEKAQQQSSSQSPSKGKKPGEGQGQGQGEGQGQGQGQGKGKGSKPTGTRQPSSPAQVSAIPGGGGGREPKGTEIHTGRETGDWAEMAPREKEKITEAGKKVMSDRYRDMVRDYFLRLAEENRAAEK